MDKYRVALQNHEGQEITKLIRFGDRVYFPGDLIDFEIGSSEAKRLLRTGFLERLPADEVNHVR